MRLKILKQITLIDKITELQNQYAKKLKTILNSFNSQNLNFLVDEINVFWYSNRNLVELILNQLADNDTVDKYLFTGVTSIDIETQELYPYITMGNIHIIDDAFSNLGAVLSYIPNQQFEENLKQKIIKIAQENITIINEYGSFIYILPLTTFINDTDFETIREGANGTFFSLFKDNVRSLEDYKKFNSITDVFDNLTDVAKTVLVFTDKDSIGNIHDRFIDFKKTTTTPFPNNIDDRFLFYSIIHSYFMRALSIMLISTKYNFIPYLRYKLNFEYFLLLSDSACEKIDIMNNIRIKTACSYIISNIFNRKNIKQITLNDFYKIVSKSNFYNNLKKDIENFPLNSRGAFKNLEQIIYNHLNDIPY